MSYQDSLNKFVDSVYTKNVVDSKKTFAEMMDVKIKEVSDVMKFEVASKLFKDNQEGNS